MNSSACTHVHANIIYLLFFQSPRPNGIIPILQCTRLFNAKGKFHDQMSYCIGLELNGSNYFVKAESAKIYNEWVEVSYM